MQSSLPAKASGYLKARIRQKRGKRVVAALACAVALCTMYALILPAIAMTKDTFCGNEAHAHTLQCYVNAADQNAAEPSASAPAAASAAAADVAAANEADGSPANDTGGANGTDATDGASGANGTDESSDPASDDGYLSADDQAKTPAIQAGDAHPTITITTDKTALETGEAATTTLNISNPQSAQISEDDGTVIRVYMRFDKTNPGNGHPTSADGLPSQQEGEYTITATGSGREYRYTITRIPGEDDDHYTYCFEIQRPLQGDTISLQLPSSYPSPASAGGTNTVWGTVLSASEKEALDKTGSDGKPGIADIPADGSNTQTIAWTTKPDTFAVAKEKNTDAMVSGDGTGNSFIRSLSYTFTTKRTTAQTQEGVGKDHVTYVEATDTFTLPEGVSFDPAIVAALQSGFAKNGNAAQTISLDKNELGTGWWYQTGGKNLLALYNAGEDSALPEVESIALSADGRTLIVKWKLENAQADSSAPSAEIGGQKLGLLFADDALKIDDPNAQEGTTYTLNNKIDYTWHYSWSGDKTGTDSCDVSVSLGKAKLEMAKKYDSLPDHYGDKMAYRITAKNTGVMPYEKLAYVTDTLPSELYLRAEDILALLNDRTWGEKLAITISNAVICPSTSAQVKDTTGSDAGSTSSRNTSALQNDKYQGMSDSTQHPEQDCNNTITISKESDGTILIILQPSGEKKAVQEASAASIQSALDELGFLVTSQTSYALRWDTTNETGDPTPIQGGQTLTWDLPCAAKDTFMLLGADVKHTHPNESNRISSNTAYAYGKPQESSDKDKLLASAESGGLSIQREFSLTKGAKLQNGSEMDETNAPGNGEIVDYSLTVQHDSSATYDLLPLVDHMSGAQVLLVSKDRNSNAAWAAHCEIYTAKDGTEYYKLSKAGTYTGVWLNDAFADTVTVTEAAGGWDTLIKWYFKDYNGKRTDTVSYKALVDLSGAQEDQSSSYELNNESWLNDHQAHRLYAPVGTKGSRLDFDKKIVSEDDIDAASKAEGQTDSTISEGQTVYYRLKIATTAQSATLSGAQLRDALPLALEDKGIRWKKGSARAEDAQPGDVWIEKYENATSISESTGDEWIIQDTSTENMQNIQWDESFSVTFTDENPLYIYVRLTFPKDADWQEYAAQYGNTALTNTFYLDGVPKAVTHHLKLEAQAYLQKGVYSTEAIARGNTATKDMRDTETDSLWHYDNDDAYRRGVIYYALVYNGGATRLYVQDLQDVLPEGFTYKSLIKDFSSNTRVNSAYYDPAKTISSNTNANSDNMIVAAPSGADVTWVDATVTATPTNDGRKVNFTLTAGNNSYKRQVHYDESCKMYYLDPGEGIKFLYLCATNKTQDTQDTAENSIAMPYYDFNHSGLEISDTHFTRVKQDWRDQNWYQTTYTPNDGSCSIIDNEQAIASGRTGQDNDTQWLYSEVRQTRGEIKPGITKELTAAISANADGTQTVKEHPAAAYPTDTLRWTVTAANDGASSILDYALTDTMQSPYVFDGTVDYALRDSLGNTALQAKDGSLFTISAPNGNTVTLTDAAKRTHTLTVGADAVKITAYMVSPESARDPIMVNLFVRLTKDENSGNYRLSIRFPDNSCGIPAGGSGVLTVHTKRTDNRLENEVFVNTCYLTPMSQTWDNTTNKGNMTALDDVFGENDKPTVRNSASVTTAYGYVTSSLKSVEEKENPTNKATCSETPNYIILPGSDSLFTYTLDVDAPIDQAMDKLILIDGLPEIGDHSAFQADDARGSEFKVAFADEPAVTVAVTAQDGTITTLDSSQYTVEYSDKTSFDADDWKGSSTWNTNSTDARSLRVKIEDASGTLIPAKSHVSIRFDAKIEGDAQPGQIAWNSFGYRYSVKGDETELEAAPLKVGVMIPTVPTIVKQIVNQDGEPAAAEAEKTFRFLLYAGESLNETDEAKLAAALTKDNRDATLIELTVKAGESASEKAKLDGLKTYSYQDGRWMENAKNWTWEDGAEYTLIELSDNDSPYAFVSVNNDATETGYTFVYEKSTTLALTAINQLDLWSFAIRKVDAADTAKTLTGAWFALYSSKPADQMTQEEYNNLPDKPTSTPEFTLTIDEGANAGTWYLYRLAQTSDVESEKGSLTFTGLVHDEYLYREIQSPMGYELDDAIHAVRKGDTPHGITVPNTGAGVSLPKTGGGGTFWFTVAGALLIAGSLLIERKRREKRGL